MDKTFIVNLTARPIIVVLDHATFRSKKYGWRQRMQPVIDHNPNTGEKTRRSVARTEPGCITIPGRGEVETHPNIAQCAQVKTWLGLRRPPVRVEQRSATASSQTRRRGRRRESTPRGGAAAPPKNDKPETKTETPGG